MSRDLLLFVAVLPTPEIQAEVTAFKEYARDNFQSGRALRSPPHVTLIPPFRLAPGQFANLRQCLGAFTGQRQPFFLTLRNFNCFRPRVIYIDLEKSDALFRLQADLEQTLEAAMNLQHDRQHAFHPHLTVAFKDLRRSVFPEAWAYFSQQTYERVFQVAQICLLRHDGRRWQVDQVFPFGLAE